MIKQNVHQKTNHSRRLAKGFSLVELLIVVAIILLLLGLGVPFYMSMRTRAAVRDAQSSFGTLLVMANTLQLQATVKPDHRLANFYWVDTNLANTAPDPATARPMSSAEFFAYLASTVPSVEKQLHILGSKRLLVPTVKEVQLAVGQPVLVFERAPNFETAVAKAAAIGSGANWADPASVGSSPSPNYTSRPYQLVSPPTGWTFQTVVDPWGHEIIYRYYTDAEELNAAANTLEDILSDEQPSPAVEYKATGGVRPAVAAYGYPSFMSAGPDGIWGRFYGTPPLRDSTASDTKAARSNGDESSAMDNIYSQEGGNR